MTKTARDYAAGNTGLETAQFLQRGKERTEAMLKVQKNLLEEYGEASRAWIVRAKAEIELWSELAKRLTASQSVSEGAEAYQNFVMQHMRMAI
jgi:hypothetical protein